MLEFLTHTLRYYINQLEFMLWCRNEKSQHRCRNIALAMVEYGLAEMGWMK